MVYLFTFNTSIILLLKHLVFIFHPHFNFIGIDLEDNNFNNKICIKFSVLWIGCIKATESNKLL